MNVTGRLRFIGAICAERAALTRLPFYENPIVKKAVVVTDCIYPVAPGALCREFLMSQCHPDTPVVIGSAVGDPMVSCALGEVRIRSPLVISDIVL